MFAFLGAAYADQAWILKDMFLGVKLYSLLC